jgi:hypothetical protein
MPVKRRTAKTRDHRITDEAIAAFKAADWMGLHRALGLKPWMPSPLDTTTDQPPSWCSPHDGWGEFWVMVRALRLELEKAAR